MSLLRFVFFFKGKLYFLELGTSFISWYCCVFWHSCYLNFLTHIPNYLFWIDPWSEILESEGTLFPCADICCQLTSIQIIYMPTVCEIALFSRVIREGKGTNRSQENTRDCWCHFSHGMCKLVAPWVFAKWYINNSLFQCWC